MQHFSQRGFVESLHANRSETEELWTDCSESEKNSQLSGAIYFPHGQP